mgnify:CR=1 FL=1
MPGLFAAGVLLGLAAGLFAGGLGLDRGIVQAGHCIQQSTLQAVRGYPALRKGEQEFVDLGLQLLVQPKAGVHLLEQLKNLCLVLYDAAQVDLAVVAAPVVTKENPCNPKLKP